MNNDPILKKRVIYIVGLVCGHLKSRHFADFVAATQGFPPGGYKTVSFRKKLPGRPASDYTISVTGSGNTVHGRPLKEYFATSWEVGAFRNPACDFCDDVLAETADIVFGDAWIPPFDQDWLGTNVVLTRNDTLAQIMRDGFAKGQIALTPITADQMAKSQAGGLRHRREGLSYRLAERRTAGNWTPQKRFEGSPDDVPGGRKAVYRQRQRLTEISHKAFRLASRYGGKLVFTLAMTGPVFRYYATVGNLKRAVAQTPAGRWLKRQLSERR